MKVFILCARADHARLFRCESLRDGVRFQRTIHGSIPEVTHEFERIAAQAKKASLILCAEPPLLDRLQAGLRFEARSRVVGTVPSDLFDVNESDLIHYVDDFVEPDGTPTSETVFDHSGEGEDHGTAA